MTLTANSADLYTAYSLGPLRLSNRFVMAPMTRNRAGTGNVPTAVVAGAGPGAAGRGGLGAGTGAGLGG